MFDDGSTRQKIFMAAIDCFSVKNYKLCSMKEIADKVGIRPSGIYKHFTNKEEILMAIMEYFRLNYTKNRAPVSEILKAAETKPIRKVIKMVFYKYEDPYEYMVLLKISRIAMNLKFENDQVRKVFRSVFLDGPKEYLCEVFRGLIRMKKMPNFDYKALAFALLSYAYMMLVEVELDLGDFNKYSKDFKAGVDFISKCIEKNITAGAEE